MLVLTGKIIKTEHNKNIFERTSEAPGLVVLTTREGDTIHLPGNARDAREFCAAYLRCVDEEIEYREKEQILGTSGV